MPMQILEAIERTLAIEPIEIIVKLLLIYILAGFIGMERAALSKPAGFRTHVLVGISAVLTVICGKRIVEISGTGDFSRIPAQLLSGIGFLGAGTILRNGFNVKGLTTAASLLTTTCIGLCVGAGLYWTAIFATIVVYIVLKHSNLLSDKVQHYSTINLYIESIKPKQSLDGIQEVLDKYKIEIEELAVEKDEDDEESKYIKVVGRHRDEISLNLLYKDILAVDKVRNVSRN